MSIMSCIFIVFFSIRTLAGDFGLPPDQDIKLSAVPRTKIIWAYGVLWPDEDFIIMYSTDLAAPGFAYEKLMQLKRNEKDKERLKACEILLKQFPGPPNENDSNMEI